jgi:Tfp pilus assembly protein PilF
MVQEASQPNDEGRGLNREDLIQMAMQTAKQNPQGARVMFQQILSQDPRSERALLWMAYLSKDKLEKRRYLARVLKVNPENPTAIKELRRMKHSEKARSNRTLIYGGIAIVAVILLVVLAVIAALAIAPLLA